MASRPEKASNSKKTYAAYSIDRKSNSPGGGIWLKGQVTIEYLVLSVVVLAMLSISIGILMQINKASRQAMDNVVFRKSALDLYATVEEVCALGAGNSRTVMIKTDMAVSKIGQDIVLENEEIGSMKLGLICPYDIAGGRLERGAVAVTAEKEEVEIRNAQ